MDTPLRFRVVFWFLTPLLGIGTAKEPKSLRLTQTVFVGLVKVSAVFEAFAANPIWGLGFDPVRLVAATDFLPCATSSRQVMIRIYMNL